VTWITPTVSGTTVSYTVQANTSTSSRIGHITVNGQAFTVTQAGTGGGGGTTTGYWQYVRTDSAIQTSTGHVFSDTHSGVEGDFTVTSTCCPTTVFGATFFWSRPPSVLIPGTALYWPASVTIITNANNSVEGASYGFIASLYPYQVASDLTTFEGYSSPHLISIYPDNGLSNTSPVGTVISYNNALQKPPTLIPGGSGGDSNGLMTILTDISDLSSDYLWSYIYQWVPGTVGSCGGACTLASAGQSLGVSGGTGSVGITATSTWNVVAVDSWIHVTSPTSGTGNSTVTFTADANTGGPRNGTLVIGGQQYVISQAGSATSTGSTSITITNPGFETIPSNPQWINCAGNGGAGTGGAGCQDTLNGIVPGWTASNTTSIGLFQPGPNLFTLPLPAAEGLTAAQVNSGTLSQTLSATLQVSTVYTLQVDVGRRLDNLYPSPPPTVQLFAGSTLIASATGAEPPLGGWTTWTGTYTSSASDPLAGQALKIVLGATAVQGDFDNVQLTAAPASGAACTESLSASSASPGAAQTTGSVTVTASGASCSWTVVNTLSWITITSATSFTGNGTVTYSVAANTGAARNGTITIAGLPYTVNQAAASGGPPAGCNYYVSPLSQSQPATASGGGNITGLIMVTTSSGCAWTAVSNNSWITVVSGGGSTSGAVSYKVDPNTASTSRQGTMTIAWQTVTVSQAAGVACAYSITPTSNNMQALGGSSSITVGVTAGNNCSWTASVSSSAASWLHLGSVTSGTGNGSVSYTADANSSTASRTGTIAIANLTFTLTQAGGASANGPTIAQGGIVNAANNRGGGIARGSFFTIYGSNLGPATPQQIYQFPIPDNLGGVTVTIAQGSTTVKAYMFYVSATQINAIMPSYAPLGNVQMAVNYNGTVSTAMAATIVSTAYGIFSTAGGNGPGIILNYNSVTDQPLNLASIPAKPGQVEVMWGTGLGPITTPDNQPPPGGNLPVAVQVTVGGQQASVDYSGRAPGNAAIDQINFHVPANAPTGCSVPVQVNAGGTWSNTVRMAISTDGKHCQDSFSPYGNLSSTGGNAGTIALIRLKFNGQSIKTGGAINAALDLGIGAFVKNSPGGDVAYSPLTNLPPPGACSSTITTADQGTVTSNVFGVDPTIASTLDAGAQLTVTGGAGGASGAMTQSLGSANPYAGLLGGILNTSSGTTLPPPFLDGGPFTVSGPGGNDVGPFTTNIALTPAITWTNPPSTINRASPLTLTWTGGDSTEVVVIGGSSTDQTSKAYGGFTCVAPAGAHSFTVPVNTLADLIPVGVATSSSGAFGMLLLMPLEPGSMQFTPLPKGLDVGVVFDTTATMQEVQVQ
jgi:uncharacterized protein (TIGR03437 family)